MSQVAGGGGNQGTGLAPNIASLLCYICMPVTSIIFIIVEKINKEVQFHAWQGTLLGAGWIVLLVVVQILMAVLGAIAGFLATIFSLLLMLLSLGFTVLWVILMVKAYQGERWKLPYIGDIAEQKAGLV